MAYSIQVSPLARDDIIETVDYIQERFNRERASGWKNEIVKAVASLSEMPRRCPVADESHDVGLELRELHHKPHRVIFTIDEPGQTVLILRIYHTARAPLRLEDLE